MAPSPAGASTGLARSRIVYADEYSVYTVDAAGGPSTRIVAPVGNGVDSMPFNPRWSPDGTWIAYMRGWAIWIVRPDGTGNHAVAGGSQANLPSWSADSRSIYYTQGGPWPAIFGRNLDGTWAPFGNPTGANETTSQWSPDGTLVAFSSKAGGGKFRIYTMSPSGSGLRLLTDGENDDYATDWSPDGRRLLVTSSVLSQRLDLVLMDRDGGNRRVVRENAFPIAWSPDGRKILFYDSVNLSGVKVMNADGTGAVSLPGMNSSADWGPGSVDPDHAAIAPTSSTPTVGTTPNSSSSPVPGPRTSAPPSVPTSTPRIGRAPTSAATGGPPSTVGTGTAGSSSGGQTIEAGQIGGSPDASSTGNALAAGIGLHAEDDEPGSDPGRDPAIVVAVLLLAVVPGLAVRHRRRSAGR